jgi:quercetin dioxygenase-like cupin family protein
VDPISVPVDDRLRWFTGTLNRVVATSAETNGAFGLMEQWAPIGFSPPLHQHEREDSALYVLEGEVETECGGMRRLLKSGEMAFMPRSVPHTFRVQSNGAHFLELVMPGGFEQYHVDVSDPAPVAEIPPAVAPDIERLIAAIGPYGAAIVGPPLHD